jgi:hypothetical protein
LENEYLAASLVRGREDPIGLVVLPVLSMVQTPRITFAWKDGGLLAGRTFDLHEAGTEAGEPLLTIESRDTPAPDVTRSRGQRRLTAGRRLAADCHGGE